MERPTGRTILTGAAGLLGSPWVDGRRDDQVPSSAHLREDSACAILVIIPDRSAPAEAPGLVFRMSRPFSSRR